jgi:hypothetical protein
MICYVNHVLTEDLCIVQKEKFSVASYTCYTYARRKAKHIHKSETIFSSERMLYKDYDRRGSVEKFINLNWRNFTNNFSHFRLKKF